MRNSGTMKINLSGDDGKARQALAESLRMQGHEVCIDSSEDRLFHDRVCLRKEGVYHNIAIEKVLLFKSDRVYSEVLFTDQNRWVIRESLSSLHERVGEGFFRLGRSRLINLYHLQEIGSDYLLLGGIKIGLSRKQRAECLQKLGWS